MRRSIFKADPEIDGMLCGKAPCGCYRLVVNPAAADFAQRLYDFIAYENAHGRQVHVDAPGIDIAKLPRPPDGIRPGDPRYVVHSTLLSSYENILRDGCLKSAAQLNIQAVGFAPLGEPPDYLNYIMFAPMGEGCGAEIVVNFRLRGAVCYDPNAAYTPQARMYFDAHNIIADGLAVRDGVHVLKVRDTLPLEPYLVLTVFAEDVALPPGAPHWTPTLFSTQADAYARQRLQA